MNNKSIKYLVLVLMALFFSATICAEKYKIIHITNAGSIIIGGVKKKKNDIFDDREIISWSNAHIKLHLKCIRTGREDFFTLAEIIKYKDRTIHEAALRRIKLATKGESSLIQKEYFLIDSIHIPAGEVRSNFKTFTDWKTVEGQMISTPVYRTADKFFYIITPTIFGNQTPPDSLFLTIRQFDDKSHINVPIYSDLKVFYIPYKKEKNTKKHKKH